MKYFEEQKAELERMEQIRSNPISLYEYIKAIEYIHEHTIDTSPHEVIRVIEKKILKELRKIKRL